MHGGEAHEARGLLESARGDRLLTQARMCSGWCSSTERKGKTEGVVGSPVAQLGFSALHFLDRAWAAHILHWCFSAGGSGDQSSPVDTALLCLDSQKPLTSHSSPHLVFCLCLSHYCHRS